MLYFFKCTYFVLSSFIIKRSSFANYKNTFHLIDKCVLPNVFLLSLFVRFYLFICHLFALFVIYAFFSLSKTLQLTICSALVCPRSRMFLVQNSDSNVTEFYTNYFFNDGDAELPFILHAYHCNYIINGVKFALVFMNKEIKVKELASIGNHIR